MPGGRRSRAQGAAATSQRKTDLAGSRGFYELAWETWDEKRLGALGTRGSFIKSLAGSRHTPPITKLQFLSMTPHSTQGHRAAVPPPRDQAGSRETSSDQRPCKGGPPQARVGRDLHTQF